MTPTGRPRSADAERRISEAAVALLTERGIGGVSVEAVAARAGVAKTTIYRRWPTKDEMIVAVAAGLKGPGVPAPGTTLREQMLHVLGEANRQDRASGWTALMGRLAMDAAEHPELVARIWARGVGPRRAYLAGLLAAGVERGELRPGLDLELLVDMLVSPVMSRIRLHREPLTDAQIEQVVDVVLAGAAPHSG
jgi:AcrR family transcriptional regulator